jgi:hypothetical protein
MDFIEDYNRMNSQHIKWSDLLNLTEIEFVGEAPKYFRLTDEIMQCISLLTGATGHDRRMLRCDDNGALLIDNAWSNLIQVETDELYPQSGSPDTYTATKANKGVLIATSTQIIKIDIVRVAGGATETIYLPPNWLYWFPNTVYSVTATVVPAVGGTANYIGITVFN